MNLIDRICVALTPGSIFNKKGKVFRSLEVLAQFTQTSEEEVLSILNAELANHVTCRPSTKGKGILVALTENIVPEEAGPIKILAGLSAGQVGGPEGDQEKNPLLDNDF